MKDMKELQPIEKLELVKVTMEGLGFSLDEMTVKEALQMYQAIKGAVQDTLADIFA